MSIKDQYRRNHLMVELVRPPIYLLSPRRDWWGRAALHLIALMTIGAFLEVVTKGMEQVSHILSPEEEFTERTTVRNRTALFHKESILLPMI